MIKVAVLDDYQDVFTQIVDTKIYKDKFIFEIFKQPFSSEDETIVALENYEAIFIMRERTPITSSIINSLPKLKYIITSGMRNNAIDIESAKKRNIIVSGTDINENPAAEITWALILGLVRNMKQEIDNMFQGYWQTTIGSELKGKMLGIIGLGKIGTQVAKVAKAFGMEVCAWSENLNLAKARELEVLPMSKEDLIKTADIISIHVVLSEKYKNLITKREFEMMKKSCFLINTSRGPIINEKDLIKANFECHNFLCTQLMVDKFYFSCSGLISESRNFIFDFVKISRLFKIAQISELVFSRKDTHGSFFLSGFAFSA